MEKRPVPSDYILNGKIADHDAQKQRYEHDEAELMTACIILDHQHKCDEDPDKSHVPGTRYRNHQLIHKG